MYFNQNKSFCFLVWIYGALMKIIIHSVEIPFNLFIYWLFSYLHTKQTQKYENII